MTDKRYGELFLELTFAMAGEQDLDRLLAKCLPMFMRKLNCVHVAVFQYHEFGVYPKTIIPAALQRDEQFADLSVKLADELRPVAGSFTTFEQGKRTYYLYDLNGFGALILGRNRRFEEFLVREMVGVTFHFGRALNLAETLRLRSKEERELKEMNRRLQLLELMIEDSRDAIQLSNEKGEIVYLNEAAAQRLGVDRSAAQKLMVSDFETAFVAPGAWNSHVKQLKEINRVRAVSINRNLQTGEEYHVEVTASGRFIDNDFHIIAISRDITQRKRDEEKLMQTTETLHSVIGALPDSILKLDEGHRFNYCKPGNQKLLYEPEQILGRHVRELLPDDLAERLSVAIHQAQERSQVVRLEYSLETAGNVQWFEARLNPVNNNETLCIIRDVTKRKKNEFELERKERMLEAIAMSTSELLSTNDLLSSIRKSLEWLGEAAGVDRTYLFENTIEEGITLTSQRFEWTNGDVSMQIDNPELQDVPLFGEFLEAAERGEAFEAIIRELPDDNELKPILEEQEILSILIIPIIVEGKYWGFVGFDDCTFERKWSAAELSLLRSFGSSIASAIEKRETSRRLEEMARFPLENPRPTLRIDMYGNVIMRNDAARAISTIVYREQDYDLPAFCKKLVGDIPENTAEFTFEVKADDRFLLIEVRSSSHESEMNLYSSDITELKATQQALIRAKEMAESASDSKSSFLANMSHEIRTPLNSIIGFADLLNRSELTHEQRNYLASIRVSGDILLDTINDILDLSKIETGNLEIEVARMDFHDLLSQLNEVVAKKASDKDIKLHFDIDPELPAYFAADVVRLRQVLLNLLGNAIKFTEHGAVTLEVTYLTALENDSAMLHFKVTDTGTGISTEQQERIFTPFSQADSSITRKFGGTGLGLAICSRLLELMGSGFEIESELGEGSVFSFSLKVKSPEGRLSEGAIDIPGTLCVSEDPEVCRAVCTWLNAWGVDKVVSYPYDALPDVFNTELVIVDIDAPSGTSLAQQLVSDQKVAKVVTVSQKIEKPSIEGAAHIRMPLIPQKFRNLLTGNEDKGNTSGASLVIDDTPYRILIVDDNQMNLVLAKDLVSRFYPGAIVTLANSGEEALKHAGKSPPHLVLMDIQMPEMSGYEATKHLRKMPECKDIPIIALTAGILKEDRQRSFDAGMTHFVSKPIRAAELRMAISESLQSLKPS